jgi:tetratricopeptide (TPR) repeat protein
LHQVEGPHTLALFAITFADQAAARHYFEARQWSFDDVEHGYLEQAAKLTPGCFPEPLGPDYPPRGEAMLLTRSQAQEQAGDVAGALESARILARLAPHNGPAQDRLACLAHRAGKDEEALDILAQWQTMHPHDPLPRVRRAVLLQRRGAVGAWQPLFHEALGLCDGRRRANVAFLAARLTLQAALETPTPDGAYLDQARQFLDVVLREDAAHAEAPWLRAAVLGLKHDFDGLAAQAMHPAAQHDPRHHLLAALCRLAAKDYAGVIAACEHVREQTAGLQPVEHGNGSPATLSLAVEASYLAALAYLELRDYPAAAQALTAVTRTPGSPSIHHAHALLGLALFHEDKADEAALCWQKLDAGRRAAWKLNETLANTVFLAALTAFEQGRFEQAADKLRQAGRLGCRDRRLGPLLLLALFRAGQQVIYGYKMS